MSPERIRTFLCFLLFWTAAAAGWAAHLYGWEGAIGAVGGSASLAAGFKLTELLLSLLTRARKANVTMIVILVGAKLLWWLAIFLGAQWTPAAYLRGLGWGVGAFLCALSSLGFWIYGRPTISTAKQSGDS